jgi:NifB/MoaA-like Fe-S oxidoreductase
MNKKTVKRLVLAKETVRSLDLGVEQVLGGIETYEYPCTYNYPSRQKCLPTKVNSECVCY